MNVLTNSIVALSTTLLVSCAVSWKTPAGFAEVELNSDELRVLKANGLMMSAKKVNNEAPGGSEPSLDFWTGNMDRSLRQRGYHPVEDSLETAPNSQDSLWWSSWVQVNQGVSQRYIVGMKIQDDDLIILEASAVDSVYLTEQEGVMEFFRGVR